MKVYYFGCYGEAGHYMHGPDMRSDWDFHRRNPWGYEIDGGLIKGHKERYVLTVKDGWTALSFVDNTVDSRPGSNSSFLAEGIFMHDDMLEIAHRYFPLIAKRVSLPLPVGAAQPGDDKPEGAK